MNNKQKTEVLETMLRKFQHVVGGVLQCPIPIDQSEIVDKGDNIRAHLGMFKIYGRRLDSLHDAKIMYDNHCLKGFNP